MIYCPACQPGDANPAWIPALCTACKDKLARDRRERASAARLKRRDAERDLAAGIELARRDRRENARKDKL